MHEAMVLFAFWQAYKYTTLAKGAYADSQQSPLSANVSSVHATPRAWCPVDNLTRHHCRVSLCDFDTPILHPGTGGSHAVVG